MAVKAVDCLSGKHCSHLEANFHDSNVHGLNHFFSSNELELECSYIRVVSPPRLKIPSLLPVVVCCQKVPFLKSFAHWQYVGRAFGSPKKVSSSKTDTCFLMEQTCKPQYQRASKYLPSFDIENWYDQSKVIWTPNTYTVLHMFTHVLWVIIKIVTHPCYPRKFDWFLWKWSKKTFFLRIFLF